MNNLHQISKVDNLRYGWTTGACATAATAAAYNKMVTGRTIGTIQITLPNGEKPLFPLAKLESGDDWVEVGVVKDAGDDPDVTHGAMILSRVSSGKNGSGIQFKAGEGVGIVTRPGLSIQVGEPAINPVPRKMMREVVENINRQFGGMDDVQIEISIPNGRTLAEQTLNGRLGIEGGLSILGTTGIVRPFSCASWIASIHRGIDVARAMGINHVAGSTGSTSENTVRQKYDLLDQALLDMGDFAGGLLKYLRRNPIPMLTIAGGPGKITKLAQGELDLHSARSTLDMEFLIEMFIKSGGDSKLVSGFGLANTAQQIFETSVDSGIPLPNEISDKALHTIRRVLRNSPIQANVIIVNRSGLVIGESRG